MFEDSVEEDRTGAHAAAIESSFLEAHAEAVLSPQAREPAPTPPHLFVKSSSKSGSRTDTTKTEVDKIKGIFAELHSAASPGFGHHEYPDDDDDDDDYDNDGDADFDHWHNPSKDLAVTAGGAGGGSGGSGKSFQPRENTMSKYYNKIRVETYDGPKLDDSISNKIHSTNKKVDSNRIRKTDKSDRATTEQVMSISSER